MRFRVKMHRHTKIFHIILCILLQIGRANKLGKWFTLSYLGQLQIMYFWIEFGIPRSMTFFTVTLYWILRRFNHKNHKLSSAFTNAWLKRMLFSFIILRRLFLNNNLIFGRIRRNMRRRRKITRRWSLFTTHGIRSAWLNYTMERSSSILKTGRVGEVRILLQRWGWGAVRHGVVVWRIRRMA